MERIARRSIGALMLMCLWCASAGADERLTVSVQVNGSIYAADLETYIDAPPDFVMAVMTDYGNLNRLSSSIKESQVLSLQPDGSHRVRTVVKLCVWIFCKELVQIQDMKHNGDDELKAIILPEGSNVSGWAAWRVASSETGTLMNAHAALDPHFWVPPIIGPFLLRKMLEAETRKVNAGFVRLYQEATTP